MNHYKEFTKPFLPGLEVTCKLLLLLGSSIVQAVAIFAADLYKNHLCFSRYGPWILHCIAPSKHCLLSVLVWNTETCIWYTTSDLFDSCTSSSGSCLNSRPTEESSLQQALWAWKSSLCRVKAEQSTQAMGMHSYSTAVGSNTKIQRHVLAFVLN